MDKHHLIQQAKPGLVAACLAALGSSLIGFSTEKVQAADLIAQANPCPRIFYEEPFNSTLTPPTNCPPNAFSGSQMPPSVPAPVEDGVIPPPLPDAAETPDAVIMPQNGLVNVQIVNATGAAITYEVIIDTDQRTLPGYSDVTLQGLSLPTNITFNRQDSGLLLPRAEVGEDSNTLVITLDETVNLDLDRSTLVIQANGDVFIN